MIQFSPSPGILRDTKIDFNLLAEVINTMIARHHEEEHIQKEVNVWIYKTPTSSSHLGIAAYEISTVYLNTTEIKTHRKIISTLLHELRHIIQYAYFGLEPYMIKESSMYAYKRLPTEQDARRFEKITTAVITCYEAHKKADTIYKKHNLATFTGTEPT